MGIKIKKRKNISMLNQIKNIFMVTLVLSTTTLFAQENRQTKDTINTEVVNVVKPYTPKISDAFKVKEIPSIDDDETATKKKLSITFFQFQWHQHLHLLKVKPLKLTKQKK